MYEVIIIDSDEKTTLNYIKKINWEQLRCKVINTSFSAKDGMDFLKTSTPDILIIDIDLKDGNGIDMLKQVVKKTPDIEIAIITFNKDFLMAKNAINLGVSVYLNKPITEKEIQTAIRKMISNIEKRDYISNESEISKELKEDNNIFILNKAINYIEKNYDKKLTLQHVSDETFVSAGHLSKIINKYLSMGYSDVLNEIRVEKAKMYLKNPEYKIYQIAKKVGFSDETYFSKIFKKYAGVTPNQYRNIFDKVK